MDTPPAKQHGGGRATLSKQDLESGELKLSAEMYSAQAGQSSVRKNDNTEGKPKSFGVLKMPIKRTVTMQPKKTVTFNGQKAQTDLKLDNSFYSITDNSNAKQAGKG